MTVIQGTLYVMTPDAKLRRDNHCFVVTDGEQNELLRVPALHVESIALMGRVHATSPALALAAEHGAAVSFLTEAGRMTARLDVPGGPALAARKEQLRRSADPAECGRLAARFAWGKISNQRGLMLRAARRLDDADPDGMRLRAAADELLALRRHLEPAHGGADPDGRTAPDVGRVRGTEGAAARVYWSVFGLMMGEEVRETFAPRGRTRRPPRDPMNCLLGFLYSMLAHDAATAVATAGLEPGAGFLHADRPGRPALALDLMEELRPALADRLALAMVNRGRLRPEDFRPREGGGVEMTDTGRRRVVAEWHERKREAVRHPLLGVDTTHGMLGLLQARLLARHLRGEAAEYTPCVMNL